jgi:NADPH-dependent ferric siderophore reductase
MLCLDTNLWSKKEDGMKRSSKGQIEATVVRKEFITPHYIRVYLTAEELEHFQNTTVGDNNKILIPPLGVKEIHFPLFDKETRKWSPPPKELAPIVRTYTHRGLDLEKRELIIDFVNHGEAGPASAWALRAQAGDKLGIMMRTAPTELYPLVDWYLLVGDATALPVLGRILETLPAQASGTCIIEVPGKEDEQSLYSPADIDFRWQHNPDPLQGSELAEVVKTIAVPEGSKFGFVAAEFASVKMIRHFLRKEKNWTQQELYAYSYWKAGVAEDESKSDRQAEKKILDKIQ